MKKKIFIFDIDNTICTTIGSNYDNAKPKIRMIKLVNSLKKNGHYIKIFTSRYMGRNKDNSKLVKQKYTKKIKKQIDSWGVKYDELILAKPSYDYFIDDKTLNPKLQDTFKLLKNFF